MKASPFLEEMLHLVSTFLRKAGHAEEAELLDQHYKLPAWVEKNNPLFKKGLIKIIKDYVKLNPKLKIYYETRHPQSENEDEQHHNKSEDKKKQSRSRRSASPNVSGMLASPKIKHQKASKGHLKAQSPKVNSDPSWMSKFQKPKRLQDLNDPIPQAQAQVKHNHNEEKHKPHNHRHSKKQKIESSDYESEEDSFELQPKKKIKKDQKAAKIEHKQKQKESQKEKVKPDKIQKEEQVAEQIKKPQKNHHHEQKNKGHQGPLKFFSRVNPDDVGHIKDELRDNSFHAKGKYGQAADEWGQHGYQRLKDTRGDSFKKTKGKLKNKAFQGAMMDIHKINSIPIH